MGLDHETWSVLAHIYSDADVLVVQLSLNALRRIEHHVDLAMRFAPLLERGVMILASGNVVHNIRRLQWDQRDRAYETRPNGSMTPWSSRWRASLRTS